MKMKTLHIVVSGKVQGVFFRAHTIEIASQLGLRGYARNLPNGDVEVIAQGSEDKLNKLIEFCRNGPPRAHVTDIRIHYIDTEEKFSGFRVKY